MHRIFRMHLKCSDPVLTLWNLIACIFLQIWNTGHISVSVLAARRGSSSAPAANSRRKEWQLAWRCCRRRQPTATAAPACAPPTLLADPGAPPPDPLLQLLVCTISFPFPFLIRFDDSSAGCVPCECSIVSAQVTARSSSSIAARWVCLSCQCWLCNCYQYQLCCVTVYSFGDASRGMSLRSPGLQPGLLHVR